MIRRTSILYAAAWTVYAVLDALSLYSAGNIGLGTAFISDFLGTVPAAVMGIGVWRLCERLQLTPRNRLRFITIHTLSAILYAVVWGGWTIYQIATYAPPNVLPVFLSSALPWVLFQDVLIYCVIAGVAYAIQANRRSNQQRQLAARAELQALRAQLDPHFLFNTLHSITALVHSDPGAVEDALIRFGSLLRYVLDASRELNDDATLEDELQFVRSYLVLEQLRLGARLSVTEDIDAETLDCLVPALTLQPVIENAVRHGIAPRASGGSVRIKTRLVDDRLLIEVADDGVGADPVQVACATGLGIALVRRRLAVRFQSDDMIDIETESGRGFTLRMSVPAHATALRQPASALAPALMLDSATL